MIVIHFCTLKEDIDNIDDIKSLSEKIILNNNDDNLNIRKYSNKKIKEFEDFGLPWSAYFSNLNWIKEIKEKLFMLMKDSILLEVRGEDGTTYSIHKKAIVLKGLYKTSSKTSRNTKGLNHPKCRGFVVLKVLMN